MIQHLKTLAFLISALVAAQPLASAAPQATWFNFAGWDHATIVTTGQTFSDVSGNVDVTVRGLPGQTRTSFFDGKFIRSGADAGRASFTLELDRPLDLMIEVQSLDEYESLTIDSSATPVYHHAVGAVPTISDIMTLTGNGVTLGADGAARGWITLENADSFTWTYDTAGYNKYEWFRVGTQTVPEPGGLGALAIAGLAVFCRRHRRG